jgi:hypothetical protein
MSRHDSGQTSHSPTSGEGGRHTREQDRPSGYPLGDRTERPHAGDGWWPGR